MTDTLKDMTINTQKNVALGANNQYISFVKSHKHGRFFVPKYGSNMRSVLERADRSPVVTLDNATLLPIFFGGVNVKHTPISHKPEVHRQHRLLHPQRADGNGFLMHDLLEQPRTVTADLPQAVSLCRRTHRTYSNTKHINKRPVVPHSPKLVTTGHHTPKHKAQ